jgi:hypothetical protein
LLLAATALVFESRIAWLVVGVAGLSVLAADSDPSNAVVVVFLLLAGASVARIARTLPPVWSRAVGGVSLIGAAALSVAASPASRFVWLPEHLLRPGWGGVWMVALAWSLIGSLGVNRESFTLVRRLWVAAALAGLLGVSGWRRRWQFSASVCTWSESRWNWSVSAENTIG